MLNNTMCCFVCLYVALCANVEVEKKSINGGDTASPAQKEPAGCLLAA